MSLIFFSCSHLFDVNVFFFSYCENGTRLLLLEIYEKFLLKQFFIKPVITLSSTDGSFLPNFLSCWSSTSIISLFSSFFFWLYHYFLFELHVLPFYSLLQLKVFKWCAFCYLILFFVYDSVSSVYEIWWMKLQIFHSIVQLSSIRHQIHYEEWQYQIQRKTYWHPKPPTTKKKKITLTRKMIKKKKLK